VLEVWLSRMKPLSVSIVLAALMVSAAIAGIAARPSSRPAGTAPQIELETMIPRQFGPWRELQAQTIQVVNPQTQKVLDKLYSQTLTRTYVNDVGYRIMLSLAYGDDQRGQLQAHKPEYCYPAQGFTLHNNVEANLVTPFGSIAARQLSTSLRERREPVTYWFTVGDTTVRSRLQFRLLEARMSLTGQVPDGLLFRVSSIDNVPGRAFEAHQKFVSDLLAVVPERDRLRLSGLGALVALKP